MRILQLIDSLAPGGAETVAVQYANHLQKAGMDSYLCATRAEGLLKQALSPEVNYLYLKRKRTLDVFAFRRLVRFIKKHKIEVIHAHSSSFFLAFMVKMRLPSVGYIWHDHYGDSEHLEERPKASIQKASAYMNTIISVNAKLKDWALAHLNCKQVVFFSNAVSDEHIGEKPGFSLKGEEGFRIICLANFRAQKDHLTLVSAFEQIQKEHPKATLHLIGKNWADAYFEHVNEAIQNSRCASHIHYYGPQQATAHLLKQATIGVLSSQSEGLPMALLEYGIAGLGVVCTAVGECETVVKDQKYCVPSKNATALAASVISLLDKTEELEAWRTLFRNRIKSEYSIDAIIPKLNEIYKNSNKNSTSQAG